MTSFGFYWSATAYSGLAVGTTTSMNASDKPRQCKGSFSFFFLELKNNMKGGKFCRIHFYRGFLARAELPDLSLTYCACGCTLSTQQHVTLGNISFHSVNTDVFNIFYMFFLMSIFIFEVIHVCYISIKKQLAYIFLFFSIFLLCRRTPNFDVFA